MSKSSNKTKLTALRSEVERIVSIGQRKEDIQDTGLEINETTKKVKTHPYSAKDIKNLLIQSKGQHSYKIIDVIELASPEFQQKIQEVIDPLLKSERNPAVVAIPINLGAVSNDTDQSINWASLVIKKSNENTLQALYQDSFGNLIDARLKQYLEGCTIHIQDHQTKQQNNNYNSGPFAVLNLHSLATTGGLTDITDKIIENQRKLLALQRLEKTEYKPLIHQLAYKKNQEELKDLVIVLKDLGYLTTKLGELSSELKYYTEAAVFYQYVITILEVDKKLNDESFIKQELTNSYQQLINIQQLIYSTLGVDQEKMPVVQKEATSNKELLLTLRKKTDQEMQEVESYYQKARTGNQEEKQKYQELYVNAARELFEKTADKMKDFLAKLYKTAEAELGKPPCKYAVIGLGSMALKQMTPYSDLEFAILTENEDYKHSSNPKVREYFKNLSHLVNFKMINLGESIIPLSKYGLDMSHLVHVAVNFDLGGKTPLGRIGGDKKYELTQTIDGMLSYVHNKENWASHIDKNLPYILENVCYVHGDKGLVETYRGKVTEFLHSINEDNPQSRLNCEIRAIKLLEEGAVEIDYLQQTLNLKAKETSFKGDLNKLQPDLSNPAKLLKLFDVKQDIYRLPDRMVYNLGLYYGIEGDNAWDTVDKLEGIINSQAALNLKNAITFATTLRLKIYSHYKAQKEDMSIFVRPVETESELKEQAKQIFHLAETDLGEQGGLFQYYYTALPLHKRLKDFCSQNEGLDETSKQIFFQKDNFYKDDVANKGFIHYRLLQYKDARDNLEKALNISLEGVVDSNSEGIVNINLEKALNNLYNNLYNPDNLYIRFALGNIYNDFDDGDKAIEQYKYCLDVFKRIYQDESHPHIAACLNNLGIAYQAIKQYEQATEYHQKHLDMQKRIHQDVAHQDVAGALYHLGEVCRLTRDYNKAIDYYNKSLKMWEVICQEPQPDVAGVLNSLGIAYQLTGQYTEAIDYYNRSLKMWELCYQGEPNVNGAGVLNNLGMAYRNISKYDQAIKCFQESLTIMKLTYQEDHPSIVGTLLNLAEAYRLKAIQLNDLGEICRVKAQYDQAIDYYKQSLKMWELCYQGKSNANVADVCNNLGMAYKASREYNQAIQYYQESIRVMKLICQEEPHPIVANVYNNLGQAYMCKGEYEQAINYHQKSLTMMELIYRKDHPNVVASLSNLGLAYSAKGEYKQAIDCSSQTLQKISSFKDDPYKKVIQDFMKQIAMSFAKQYSLNPQEIANKILFFASQGLDFTDYQLHFNSVIMQENRNESEQQVAEMIEKYRLALIFLPKEQSEIKLGICNKLAELTGEDHKSIELWLAIAERDTNEVEKLAAAGADLDHAPFINTTPLIQAVVKGDIDMVSALILGKVDINKPNNDQDQITPLYYSLGFNRQPINVKIVELLLINGADVNKPMFDGDTPMHMAHYTGNKEVMKLLLHHGGKINAQNVEGKTPLHYLLKSKDVSSATKFEIIQEFRQLYDMTIKDQDGKNITDCAKEHCPELLPLLANELLTTNANMDDIDMTLLVDIDLLAINDLFS